MEKERKDPSKIACVDVRRGINSSVPLAKPAVVAESVQKQIL